MSDRPFGAQMRRFYFAVAALTLYVAFWGFFFPGGLPVALPGFAKGFDDALPFDLAIPPLHARFIGAFYLAATVGLVYLARRARRWSDARIFTWVILAWTAMLGWVSFLHFEIFDWTRPPVVAWFPAYVLFPLYAGWLVWRGQTSPTLVADGSLPLVLRTLFFALAIGLVPLALALFLVPEAMVGLWPWKILPILAQVYSAPFLAFGVGGLLSARARAWSEVRGFVYTLIAFALGTLVASAMHRALFDPGRPVTWVWFAAFGIGLVLAIWGAASRPRGTARGAAAQAGVDPPGGEAR